MSYSDDFWNALEEEQKKKKKNGSSTVTQSSTKSSGNSYTDEFFNELQSLQEKSVEIDNSFLSRNGRFEDEDIAPVRSDGYTRDNTWLKSGAFSDGYQFGDLSKSLGATFHDTGVGILQGLGNMAEGVLDLGTYAVSGALDLVGADDAADAVWDFAEHGYVNDAADWVRKNAWDGKVEENSFLGEKGTSVAQGLGQVAGIILTGGLGAAAGLGTVGTTLLTTGTTFATGMGSGISEASNNNASKEDAVTYGAMTGAIEAGTELLFGGLGKGVQALGVGRGIGGLDDIFAKKVASKLTNKIASGSVKIILGNTVEGLIKAGGESIEEALAGYGSAFAKWLTYKSDEELKQLVEDENILDQAITGFITAGIAQGGSVYQSTMQGRDFVTGNTQNEQAVIDKVVEDRIAEEEKNGKKLSGRDKNKILEEVVRDMERGYISTDTIEEVLGGDSYKSYQDTLAKEDAIKKEFETLKGKQDATLEEQARFREVRREYYRNQSNSQRTDLKNKLRDDVFNRVKNDRLVESYLEKARVGEDFQADLNKYKGTKHEDAAKKTLENAIKAGANNTNRVHDLVDMAADLSSETGYVYDFKDNEQIKNDFIERKTKEIAKLEAIENRTDAQNEKIAKLKDLVAKVQNNEVTVNGNVDPNGIVLNLDSAKPLNRIIGHEITHTVEKAKHYEKLRDSLFSYAKSKGVDIDAELEMKALEYEGVEGTTAEAELVADMVGDYLFTDSDFVKNLSTENRNLAQRIYDEIKYFLTKATQGSKEERELLRVKHEFEKAFREAEQNREVNKNTADSGVKYSFIGRTADGSGIYKTNYQADTPKSVKQAELIDLVQNVWSSKPITLTIVEDGEYTDITAKFNPELAERSDLSKIAFGNRKGNAAERRMTLDLASDLYQIASEAKFNYSKDATPKPNNPAHDGVTKYHYFLTNLVYKDNDGGYIQCHMNIDVKRNAEGDWFYSFAIEKGSVPQALLAAVTEDSATLPGNNIPYMGDVVNSVSEATDKDYLNAVNRGDTETAQKMVDDAAREWSEGNEIYTTDPETGEVLLKFYRSADGGRTVWNGHGNNQNQGVFLTSDPYIADAFDVSLGIPKGQKSGQHITVYAKAENPFEIDANGRGYTSIPVEEKSVPNWLYEASSSDVEWSDEANDYVVVDYIDIDNLFPAAFKQGYDAVIVKNVVEGVGGGLATDVVLKDGGKQMKSADPVTYDDNGNVIPLSQRFNAENDDIRYSLSDSNGKTLSNEQAEFFKDSKARDENGNLKVVYHGTRKADFTVFKRNATYFTDNKEMADSYSPNGDMYEGYVNITKPYEIDANGEKWSKIPIDDATRKFLQEYGSSVFKEDGKWRTSPADIVAAIEEAVDNGDMDYDGIIIRNVDDTGSYYKGKDSHLATDYIVFNSNQFKNADNKAPTSDPDIRFSLSSAVEETKDLVALHNLSADKLTKSLELGGLPMPSLAITKADIPHSNFGEITLVFGKETIDPKASKKNKVYSADAWTPIFPNVEYEADSKVVSRVSHKLNDLGKMIDEAFQRDLSIIGYSIEDYLNRQGGEEGLVQYVMDNYGLKAAYLEDIGKHIEPVTKQEEVPRKFNPAIADKYLKVMEILGVNTAEEVMHFNLKEARDTYGAELEEVFPGITQSGLRMGKVLGSVASYLKDKDSPIEYKTVIDSDATNKAVNDAIDADGFESWTRNLFSGVEKDSGIYNNKDWFTPSGNRRSFKQTHLPVTLENIVKAMASQNDGNSKNVSGFNGVKTLRAATAETFKSIGEMHDRKGRLQHLTQEQADEITDNLHHRLSNIIDAIDTENAQQGDRNPYIRYDQIGQVLSEIGEGGKYNVADIQRVFSEYGRTVSDDTAQDVKQLLYDVTQMPVNIFEAKPERVVGFDEAKVFVIPRNADVKLKQELLNRGYSIAEYDPDVEGDRQKVVNQFEEYRFSLSDASEQFAPIGKNDFFGKDFRKKSADDIAPVENSVTNVQKNSTVSEMETVAEESSVTEEHPVAETVDADAEMSDTDIIKTVKDKLNAKITNSTEQLEQTKLLRDWVSASYAKKIADVQAKYDSKKNKDTKVAVRLKNRIENLKRVSDDLDADLAKRISDIENRISNTQERMKSPPKKDILEVRYERINKHLEADKADLAKEFEQKKAELQSAVADKDSYISNKANELYWELRNLKKGVRASEQLGYLLDHGFAWGDIKSALINAKHTPGKTVNVNSAVESVVREALNEDYDNRVYELDDMDNEYHRRVEDLEAEAEKERQRVRDDAQKKTRSDIRTQKLAEVETHLNSKGFSLDNMLDHPKRQLSTLETVDTMPQRVMEKTFGYKEGQALADVTVNKVAQDDTKATKWLDSITNRKNGLLAQLSKQYHIKPGSKAIQAVQMYAEGFFVDKNNDLVAYGDAELAQDFPNAETQKNIKALAKDPRIRQFYDDTLNSMNEVLVRNGYPAVPRLDNYYLHFIADEGILSKLGVPFNPNDAKAKDLPTDLAGQTADLKPGRPFFSSGMHREGKRTSFDLFAGMERYANMAKNVIYQTDNIQTLRAIQYHLCERFGQAQGLDNLGNLDPDEFADRIQQVYSGHLSTFASFLNTEANILAGKTSMIDRALSEGVLGRRVLTFLDAVNKQFGSAAVGGNVSSANTNWLPAVRELATSNPADSLKAFAQTIANIFSGGKFDSFREDSSVYVRRKGTDRFNRTLWQKMQDPGFALMGMVDSVSTELIARTEYNKAIREGKSAEQAHYESDLKTSRLMGDRSIGQMPQMYTSRAMQLILKFQLEVRNDLDSMFYDTLQEAKVSNEDIENQKARNAKTASQVALKYATTAVALHLFGTAFESIAGYNPAFDIIEAISKAFGLDDDEEDEDTVGDNLRQGAMTLLEDMPYANLFLDGGRIPVSAMFPDLKEIISGEDENGNEVTIGDIALDIAPYLLPTGGSQLKKTWQGMSMFSDDHPVAGSYTDSGNLRFPVEDTFGNRLQAGLFGQYASENARDYFDNGRSPLKEKQIQEFIDVDIPIRDYWEYREGLSGLDTTEEKLGYISTLDLPYSKKNILANNIVDRKDPVDMEEYGDMSYLEEFDYSQTNKNLHDILQNEGISSKEYESFDDDTKDAYKWAAKNPEKYTVSTAIASDFMTYYQYKSELGEIESDKDEDGKSISGSKKEKVINYIESLPIDYGQKIILFKSMYDSKEDRNNYNADIVEYLDSRDDISYEEMVTILTELGMRVEGNNVYWD